MRSGETPEPPEVPDWALHDGQAAGTPLSEFAAELRQRGVELDLTPVTAPEAPDRLRVAVDSSVLLGSLRNYVAAAIHLKYVEGYWSSWIVAELVRKRTEWIAERAVRDRCDVSVVMLRLNASRGRVRPAMACVS